MQAYQKDYHPLLQTTITRVNFYAFSLTNAIHQLISLFGFFKNVSLKKNLLSLRLPLLPQLSIFLVQELVSKTCKNTSCSFVICTNKHNNSISSMNKNWLLFGLRKIMQISLAKMSCLFSSFLANIPFLAFELLA